MEYDEKEESKSAWILIPSVIIGELLGVYCLQGRRIYYSAVLNQEISQVTLTKEIRFPQLVWESLLP